LGEKRKERELLPLFIKTNGERRKREKKRCRVRL